jgi:predicted AlkP superfamily pyrophosphatase or phosphodiesterase
VARCVVVLTDGLRPDAITRTHMPALHALGHDYTRAANANTVRPSVTVAALASLATGVSPATHGLVEPGLGFLARLANLRPLARELSRARVPTLVGAGSLAARSRPVAWALTACAGVDRLLSAANADAADIVAETLPHLGSDADGPLFTFIYLPDCDRTGHASGWMSPEYFAAASRVDSAIGALAERLGDTLLIVLADHGGGGVSPNDHDAPHELNDRIPLVLAGPGVRRHCTITRDVSLLDVPPTVLHWFGVPAPASYEGRALLDAFEAPLFEGATV